jgi:uncharacterized protein YeaO (DUF488 family)
MVKLKRIYDTPGPEDGERYLVERLWPRGVSKEAAQISGWLRDIAPSPELRQWYGHDPERWPEFRRRYLVELEDEPHQRDVAFLLDRMRSHDITLVFAARDELHSSAAVLREYLLKCVEEAVDDAG